MTGLAGRSLLSGRPLSHLTSGRTVDPPNLPMGLLIAVGLASSVLLLAAAVSAVWSIRDRSAWLWVSRVAVVGYVLGATSGLCCYFLVGATTGVADKGMELFVHYQVSAVLVALISLGIRRLNLSAASGRPVSIDRRLPRGSAETGLVAGATPTKDLQFLEEGDLART
ncbi:MAG: hypothetical protein ABIS86_10465 [Streptosporangiaceae bacterium]